MKREDIVMYYMEPKTLIVVYKDELLVNQLKKLIETKDDGNENAIVGTTDGSVQIVAWTEKVWLEQKKTGNITAKVLFLGEIKGTDKLVPVIDVKFSQYGVKYGWAGNQAVLIAEPKDMKTRDEYASFIADLGQLPAPASVKDAIKATETHKIAMKKEDGKLDVKGMFSAIGANVVDTAKDTFSNKKSLIQQMLIYGVINLYNKDLEAFIKA